MTTRSTIWRLACITALACMLMSACSDGSDGDSNETTTSTMGKSVSSRPPTEVFPLGGEGRVALDTGGGEWTTIKGKRVYLIELRGWLTPVNGIRQPPAPLGEAVDKQCNPDDPDWHYNLEIDPRWADNAGINLSGLLRVTNMINWVHDRDPPHFEGIHIRNRLNQIVGTPLVHVELNGWDPQKHPGEKPPADWRTFDRNCDGVLWPYDPIHPISSQPPLREGQYVRMYGGLITDSPHINEGSIPFGLLRYMNMGTTDVTDVREMMDRWARGSTDKDPNNPARWTEMHPPDIIDVLDENRTRQETLRSVMVSSEACPTACPWFASVDINIYPPGPKPAPNATVGFRELVYPESNTTGGVGSANGNGATIDVVGDHIRVRAAVFSGLTVPRPAKFAALYRVYWELPSQPPPHPTTQLPTDCDALRTRARNLQTKIQLLQRQLQHAAPNEKADIVEQIRALNEQLSAIEKQLETC